MTQQALDKILHDYRERIGTYTALGKKVARAVSELVRGAGLSVHAVTARVKQRARLREKLEAPGNKYQDLQEITDITGVRVITYFADQVEMVSDLIEANFVVDYPNSVDKGLLLDPDRFGYLSRHYVVQLDPSTLRAKERAEFQGVKCEIQVRSILQHAWAEIEHDLGYKSKAAVPWEIRRSFSRLAGLLEIADTEFMRIRDNLYDVVRDIDSQIEAGSQMLPIDKPSLWSMLRRSRVVTEADEAIRQAVGASRIDDMDAIEQWIPIFGAAGFQTIGDLEQAVEKHKSLLPAFAREFRQSMGRYPPGTPIARGLSIIRAVDAEVAEKGLDALRAAYAGSGRHVSEAYVEHLAKSFEAARKKSSQ